MDSDALNVTATLIAKSISPDIVVFAESTEDVAKVGLILGFIVRSARRRKKLAFAVFVLTIAAAEAAMALALVVLLFRRRESLDASEWASMKG